MINIYSWITNVTHAKQLLVFALTSLVLIVVIIVISILSKSRQQDKLFSSFFLKYATQLIIGHAIVIALILGLIIIPTPTITSPTLPMFDPVDITHDHPFTLTFDRPVSNDITATIKPHIPGEWKLEKNGYLIFNNQLSFYPDQSLMPDTEYIIEIDRILPITWVSLKTSSETLFTVKTPSPPYIKNTSPHYLESYVSINQPIIVTLSHPTPPEIKWSYDFTPSIESSMTYSENRKQITITPQKPLNYSTQYHLNVYQTISTLNYLTNSVEEVHPKKHFSHVPFTTANAASIDYITPTGENILPQEKIIINFNQAMSKQNTEKAISTIPNHQLNYAWSNPYHLSITPSIPWKPDTPYTLTIDASAKSKAGIFMKQEINHVFKTVGPVDTIGLYPANEATNFPTVHSPTITFNQPVDHQSAESHFFITPDINGEFSWVNNVLLFTPESQLEHNHEYNITLRKGIKSIHALDSIRDITINFNTQPERIVLDVPQVKQSQTFACYAAAAQMALMYKGENSINQNDIIDQIGYDNTPRSFTTNTWGNPNNAIVGTLNGSHPGGYGVHWDPVFEVLNQHSQPEIKRNWNIKDLLTEVRQENPVIIWWINGVWPARVITWHTLSGEEIYAVSGMHVEVVKGFIGTINDPQYIITNDPWRGERRYTPETFNNLWRWFSNTAIVVR